jgi:hypothetical protein
VIWELKDTTDTDRSASYLDVHFKIDSEGAVKNETTTKEMISISPLWTFHLYVATFQQHLHMEYISIFPLWSFHLYIIIATFQQHLHMEYLSLSWYDISELVVPIRISLIVAANKEATEPRVLIGYVEVITSKGLQSPPWLGWSLWNICVTNDHRYVAFVVNTFRSFPHSCLITGFVTRLTRQVSLVEQELPTLLEHLSFSPPLLVFSGVCVT